LVFIEDVPPNTRIFGLMVSIAIQTRFSFTRDTRREMEEVKNQWSAQGRRVILLGRKVLSNQAHNFLFSTSSGQLEKEVMKHARTGLTLVGLVAIKDPLRDEIPEVIRILRRAGIRIFMVSSLFSLHEATEQQHRMLT
jgi:sodium/potassium-transporting ATPase subunit alpha